MCLLNWAGVKDHLHDSKNWPRSPFDRSNFVRLSSKLRVLGFRRNWMEIRCRVVLKRCVNVIGRNACTLAWLTKWTKVIGRRLLDNLRWNISMSYELTLLSADLFPSLMMLRSYGPQQFWSDKLDISLRPSNSADILRDVIVQTFHLAIWPVSRVLQIETKIS